VTKKIRKKELERRKKISNSLKKYWSQRKKLENEIAKDFERIAGISFESDRKKSKRKPKTSPKRSTKQFTEKRKKVKVKTFPSKKNKEKFFFSDKKAFELKRNIHLRDALDFDRVRKVIAKMRPRLKLFYLKSKGRKTNKLMNMGYKIKLEFRSFKDKSKKTTIETTSFAPSFMINQNKNIDKTIDGLIDNMQERFNDYLKRQGFYSLQFQGIEAEMEA